MSAPPPSVVVGIDLGTTFSCAGVWSSVEPGVRIVALDGGHHTMPSCVAMGDQGQVAATGREAERLPGLVRNVKRDVGSIKKGAYAEAISAHILRSIKERVQREVGVDTRHAVVTVPAYFTNEQRASTKRAAEQAGWTVAKILNEPTAAALAYGYRNSESDKNILIYDWGGGTFDVTILTMDQSVFEVRSTAGNTHLGGEDLTGVIAAKLREQCGEAATAGCSDEDIRRCCEHAKCTLSTQPSADLAGCCTLTRFAFNTLCEKQFDETIDLVNRALRDADMSTRDIHEVVLVGGSTRMPHVTTLLRERFPSSVINNSLHPDESVAYGATIQAALLSDYENRPQHIMLMDVIPLTLGVRTAGGVMTPVLERNTSIPVSAVKRFSTHMDNQTCISVSIHEGEMPLVKDCVFLGNCVLEDLPARPRGELVVVVTFAVDASGILNVSAVEETCGVECTITLNSGVTTLNDIDRQCALKRTIGSHDAPMLESIRKRLALSTYIKGVRDTLPSLRRDENIPNTHIYDLEEYMVYVDSVLASEEGACDAATVGEFDRTIRKLVRKLSPHSTSHVGACARVQSQGNVGVH